MKRKAAFNGLILCLGVFMIAAFGRARAADEEAEPKDFQEYTLGEIVVKGERPGVRQVGLATEVTPEDIEATNSRTVSEAMKHVPGVIVTTGRKNEPEIQLHGFTQSQALILIDGVPYYETNYGKLDLSQISTENVARIDVIKGTPSVLYGPNAEAGVVNIITKKPTEKPSISASIEAGERDAYRVALSHGMKKGIFNYWLSYTHREWDAWRLSDDFEPRDGVIQYRSGGPPLDINTQIEDGGYFRDNSDYESDNFWAKVGVEPSEGSEYYANFHYVATEKGDPYSVDQVRVFRARPSFSQFDRIEKYDDWGIDLSGRQRIVDPFSLQGTLFYHKHVDDYVSYYDLNFDDEIAVSRYKDYILGGMLLADYSPVEWDILRMSLHYRGDSHEERDDEYLPFAESFSYTGSVGLENEFIFFHDKLSIVTGASYDWFNVDRAEQNVTGAGGVLTEQLELETPDTMDDVNFMAGVSYNVYDATRIFGSVARKTRFPTLSQLYSTRSGNVDLEAERSVNYVAGISSGYEDIFRVEVAPFYHDITDRISRDGPSVLGTYQNYAKVAMRGVELSTELRPCDSLLFKAGYTYIHARDRSEDRVTDQVTNVPKHKVDVRARYTVPFIGTRLDLSAFYAGESYSQLPTPQNPDDPVLVSDAYTVFNAKITQPFLDHFEAYFSMNNLFDKDYEPESGFPAPGRMFWVGLAFNY